nr:unnamed protein product [Callosobruchus chinensis]
MLSYHSHV